MNPLIAYLAAVLGITLIGCVSVVALEIGRPEGFNAQASYTIVGICTTVLTVLLGIIKAIGTGQQVAIEAKLVGDKAFRAIEENTAKTEDIAHKIDAAIATGSVPAQPKRALIPDRNIT